jgi:type II secretion system protein G
MKSLFAFKLENRKAFTLIELLVVIAIVGILSGFLFISMSGTISSANDAKRKADVDQIRKALLMYAASAGSYPTDGTVTPCQIGNDLSCTVLDPILTNNGYFSSIPRDPNGSYYTYQSTSGTDFTIYSTLSGGDTYTYTGSSGVGNTPPWSCGSTLTDSRDSKSYPTVLIGTQCWMAQNLDYNNGCQSITWVNNSSVGWCGYYTGGPFTNEGLLYQWGTAMDTTSGNPGICPAGWHVPSDTEWFTLENYLKDSGQTCNAVRGTPDGSPSDCSTAGTKMRSVAAGGSNSSGFNGLFTGFREYDGSYYSSRPDYGIFWSSSVYGTNAIYRELMTGSTMITRYSNLKASAYSIRCLKN